MVEPVMGFCSDEQNKRFLKDVPLFGSVNLDMRSFWLNFEATLFIYCRNFTRELLAIQQGYIEKSDELDLAAFMRRGKFEKFKENTCLLVSPLI